MYSLNVDNNNLYFFPLYPHGKDIFKPENDSPLFE